MNTKLTPVSASNLSTTSVQILAPGAAEKLADLYLPVYLRDFYLNCNPLVQCFLYLQATRPEEFFTLVLQEEARISKLYAHRHWGNRDGISVITETIPLIGMTEPGG